MSEAEEAEAAAGDVLGDVDVYGVGTIMLSVCAPKTMPEEVLTAAVNVLSPTELPTAKWKLSEDDKFADGAPMPNPCPKHENRHHLLFVC